jgi:hypothetical protein
MGASAGGCIRAGFLFGSVKRKMSIKNGLHQKKVQCQVASRVLTTLVFAFALDLHSVRASDSSPASFDYSLVGLARFDGVSYASLLNTKTQEHVFLSTANPEGGLKLSSITTDNDPLGPSAWIQNNGVSILLKLGSGAFQVPAKSPTASVTDSQASVPFSAASLSSILPMPGAAKPASLNPPPGGSLPLVFRPVNSKALNLTGDQQAIINQLRQSFVDAVNGPNANSTNAQATSSPNGNTNDSSGASQNATTPAQQLQNWRSAQELSDDLFKMRFGYQAFNQYQMSVIQQNTP